MESFLSIDKYSNLESFILKDLHFSQRLERKRLKITPKRGVISNYTSVSTKILPVTKYGNNTLEAKGFASIIQRFMLSNHHSCGDLVEIFIMHNRLFTKTY
jgi:hypothetical protein